MYKLNSKNIFIAILLLVSFLLLSKNKVKEGDSIAEKIIASGEVRLGYIVYPPLLFKDGNGRLTGISYDIIEAVSKKIGVNTHWTEEVGWGTALEGLRSGRYDVLGTQIWPDSQRAREGVFTISPMSNEIYPVVKINDHRFDADLNVANDSKIRIGGLDGSMSQIIANDDYPKATKIYLPQLSSYSEVLLDVANGKSDISFTDMASFNTFDAKNRSKLKVITKDRIRIFGNSFAFKRGENSAVEMWNIALQELINDGTVERILKKYGVEKDFVVNK